MTQITLSSGQLEQLGSGTALVECRDGSGNLVGYLHVSGKNDPIPIPDFSAEQMAQFEHEPGGRSLSEILADLQQRR